MEGVSEIASDLGMNKGVVVVVVVLVDCTDTC